MTPEAEKTRDLVIIGSGAAGLAAALYARRYLMTTIVIGGAFGGETATAGSIENYPAIKKIDGFDLMEQMKEQAISWGTEMQDDWVSAIELKDRCFTVHTKGNREVRARAVIFANGAERRRLGLPNEDKLANKGIHYCWTCDDPLYGGKRVAMVGGGDSSVKGINFLAEYTSDLYLIVRGDAVQAEPVNRERMERLGDKVKVLLGTEVKELVGSDKLEKLTLTKPWSGSSELAVDGLFVEIGAKPSVELAVPLGVALDERGYIKVDNMMKTNIPGIFAAGDVTNHFGSFKQDITAAAMGSVAATSAYEYKKFLAHSS